MEEEIQKKEETVQEEILEEVKNEEVKDAPPKEEKAKKLKKPKIDKEKEELRVANLELKEKLLRINAEMQNMRRRYDLDISNLHKYDGQDLVEKLLPIIDNFERALKIKTEENAKFLDGFKMIYDNLVSILNGKGITEIDVLGRPFNPSIMNAVVTEVNNEVEENTVLDVLQKGYMYNDRIIRPAMVKVSEKESE